MGKIVRNIVKIDESKCNGCGICVNSCAEGAIQIVDGKAKLVSETYCDGLGACLADCPQDAITIEQREADPFDVNAVEEHLKHSPPSPKKEKPFVCPGSRAFSMQQKKPAAHTGASDGDVPDSELTQWPVQLHLVPVQAPYWHEADILIAADCVPFAFAGFHSKLLRGRKVIIACPKLDDTSTYVDKLQGILEHNEIKSVTVAHMEVPCCTGIVRIVEAALKASGKDIPFEDITIGINGTIQSQ